MKLEVSDVIIPQDFHRGDSELTEVVFMPSVREIGLNAFRDCPNLHTVKISKGVQRIGRCAFMMCKQLAVLEIEDGLQDIEKEAFWNCQSLTRVRLPPSLSSVGAAAFSRCANLVEVDGLEGKSVGDGAFEGSKYAEAQLRIRAEIERAAQGAKSDADSRTCSISNDSIVDGPGEIIEFLGRTENRNVLKHEITYRFLKGGNHGSCVQLGQYFCQSEGDALCVHFEVEAVDGKIFVEIHSELGNTPIVVHDYIYSQFRVGHNLAEKGAQKHCADGRLRRSFRFATHRIDCKGRVVRDVVADIAAALEAIYKKYEGYLTYIEDYFYKHGSTLTNCRQFGL